MKTSPEALRGVLERRLPGVCLITGTEPLLIAECCDAIRERARAEGYVEREVHFLERGFDWNGLLSGAATLSLFASRRILELKFPAAPDAEAGKALTALAAQPPPDTLLLVSGTLDWKGQKSAWLKAFEKAGLLVMTREIGRSELPRWITERLAHRSITVEPAAAELLADRVEGNLLAAQQAIERIVLLKPQARLDVEAVEQLVADSARYDIFELTAATLAGRPGKALRILSGLKAEGHEPTLVLWALSGGVRSLSRAEHWSSRQRRPINDFHASERTWWSLRKPIEAALRRLSRVDIDALLQEAARADRVVKGGSRGDPWVALERLVARIGGIRLAA